MHTRADALRNDRKRLLAEANRELTDGDERRAIQLYRRVLLEEPRNVAVALRAAPLLARQGHAFEAWLLFRMASQELLRARRREDCLSALREACRWVPHEFDVWRLRAELETKLDREEDALETLLEGRRAFRAPHVRGQAIALLERARAIEPWDLEIGLDLAQLYAREEQKHAALELLDLLALRVSDLTDLRRVRARRFRITFALADAWAWAQTFFSDLSSFDEGASALAELELDPPRSPEPGLPARPLVETTLPLVEALPDKAGEPWLETDDDEPRITH